MADSVGGSTPTAPESPRSIPLPTVRRVHEDRSSHIEPPLDQSWSESESLAWYAAVVALDTGLDLSLWSHAANNRADMYGVGVGRASASAFNYDHAWTYLSGIGFGARAARSGTAAPADDTAEALSRAGRMMATDPRDWGLDRSDAWLYGLLVGWDCEDPHEHNDLCGGLASDQEQAMHEVASQHGWTSADVARLRRYRAAVRSAGTAAPTKDMIKTVAGEAFTEWVNCQGHVNCTAHVSVEVWAHIARRVSAALAGGSQVGESGG